MQARRTTLCDTTDNQQTDLITRTAFATNNYIQVERLKHNLYTGRFAESYFWRTYDQQEVDLVEEHGGRLHGFEIKWSTKSHARAPKAWTRSYPGSSFGVVSPANYLDFIVPA